MSLIVKYVDAPKGAQESAAMAATVSQPFSHPSQLKTLETDIPWMSPEPAGWPLDGTGRLLPEAPADIGWWSREMSDEEGNFAQPPQITVTLPQPYTASGLSFRFWPALQHWCSCVEASWYRGDERITQAIIRPTAADWVEAYRVEDFDRVTVRLLSTNEPHRFAKLQHLQIGQMQVFFRDEIVQVRLLQEADPALCTLPVDTMTVQIRDRKGRVMRPQKDQAIHLYRDGVLLATHYITDFQRLSRYDYTFRCQSAVGRLEDAFMGGVYHDYPLQSLLDAVLNGFPYSVSENFADKTLTGHLPICTRRQALQQIAFAIGAAVQTRGNGTICLVPPETALTGGFLEDSIFAGAELKQEMPIAAVALSVHSYTPDEAEQILLKETMVSGTNVLFTFPEPHYGYLLSGGTLEDSGANWVRITAEGSVTLTAMGYRHNTYVLRQENPQASAQGTVLRVEKATLIHSGNAAEALQRVYDCQILQTQLRQQVVVTDQQVGQWVESRSPWGGEVTGYIATMESTFTDAGHRAEITIRGMEVAE